MAPVDRDTLFYLVSPAFCLCCLVTTYYPNNMVQGPTGKAQAFVSCLNVAKAKGPFGEGPKRTPAHSCWGSRSELRHSLLCPGF